MNKYDMMPMTGNLMKPTARASPYLKANVFKKMKGNLEQINKNNISVVTGSEILNPMVGFSLP